MKIFFVGTSLGLVLSSYGSILDYCKEVYSEDIIFYNKSSNMNASDTYSKYHVKLSDALDYNDNNLKADMFGTTKDGSPLKESFEIAYGLVVMARNMYKDYVMLKNFDLLMIENLSIKKKTSYAIVERLLNRPYSKILNPYCLADADLFIKRWKLKKVYAKEVELVDKIVNFATKESSRSKIETDLDVEKYVKCFVTRKHVGKLKEQVSYEDFFKKNIVEMHMINNIFKGHSNTTDFLFSDYISNVEEINGGLILERVIDKIVMLDDDVIKNNNNWFDNCKTISEDKLSNFSHVKENVFDHYDPNSYTKQCPITSIEIPESIEHIDSNTFIKNEYLKNCLEKIVIPDNWIVKKGTISGNYCFINTTRKSMFSLNLSSKVGIYKKNSNNQMIKCQQIDNLVKESGGICYLDIPNYITNLDGFTIDLPRNIASLKIPENIEAIGDNFFSNCSGLANIYFSEKLKKIGECAFANCPNLRFLVLPKTLTKIGKKCFSSCVNLSYLEINGNIEKIAIDVFDKNVPLRDIKLSVTAWNELLKQQLLKRVSNCNIIINSSNNNETIKILKDLDELFHSSLLCKNRNNCIVKGVNGEIVGYFGRQFLYKRLKDTERFNTQATVKVCFVLDDLVEYFQNSNANINGSESCEIALHVVPECKIIDLSLYPAHKNLNKKIRKGMINSISSITFAGDELPFIVKDTLKDLENCRELISQLSQRDKIIILRNSGKLEKYKRDMSNIIQYIGCTDVVVPNYDEFGNYYNCYEIMKGNGNVRNNIPISRVSVKNASLVNELHIYDDNDLQFLINESEKFLNNANLKKISIDYCLLEGDPLYNDVMDIFGKYLLEYKCEDPKRSIYLVDNMEKFIELYFTYKNRKIENVNFSLNLARSNKEYEENKIDKPKELLIDSSFIEKVFKAAEIRRTELRKISRHKLEAPIRVSIILPNDAVLVFKEDSHDGLSDSSKDDQVKFKNSEYFIFAIVIDDSNPKDLKIEIPECGLNKLFPRIKYFNFGENNRVFSIPPKTFADCVNLNIVTFPNGLKSIESFAFKNSRVDKLSVPENVDIIYENAFDMCEKYENEFLPYNGLSVVVSHFRLIGGAALIDDDPDLYRIVLSLPDYPQVHRKSYSSLPVRYDQPYSLI